MSLSLRPLVVRFADPSVEDAHVDIIYERVKQEDEPVWPQLYDITVKDLKAVSYTHLTLPTICSV